MSDENNNHENNNNHIEHPTPSLALIAERQRLIARRVGKLERKQAATETMLNRVIGGTAILIGAGVFIGWLFTVGSGLLSFMK